MLQSKVIDRVEELQMSKSHKVFEISNKIIETYFDSENLN